VLLDEPFSNLDVEVRLRLRSELPEVLARCGAGGLLVTHDPEEALAICDRVGVLREGVLHQCASPRDLVDRPATAFVGRFLLQGNLLPAQCEGEMVMTPLGRLVCAGPAGDPPPEAVAGDPTEVMVGDQAVEFEADPEGPAVICGREFLGRDWRYRLRLDHLPLHLRLPLDVDLASGQRGHLRLKPGEPARMFPCGRPLVAL
jgi:iron(III) transport system ATP-binding protein